MVLNLAHDQVDPSVLVITFHYLTAQSKENITIHKWLNNASRRVFKSQILHILHFPQKMHFLLWWTTGLTQTTSAKVQAEHNVG